MKNNTLAMFASSVIVCAMHSITAVAATPAQEKLFVDGFKRAVEMKDTKALHAMLYVKDADPNALEFFRMMIVSDIGSKIDSIKLVDLTAEESKKLEGGGKSIDGRPIKMPLKPIKNLIVTTRAQSKDMKSSGSSEWFVAEHEGKLVIPVPAIAK
jgi:hypothetical protein